MGYRRRCHHRRCRLSVALITACAVLVLAGCSLRANFRPDTYTVQRGDTLSKIANSYGLDWHDLARWNRIGPPYRIDIGQQLSLDPYPQLENHPEFQRVPRDPRTGRPRVARAPQDTREEQNRAIQASTPQLTRTIERTGESDQATSSGTDRASGSVRTVQPAEPIAASEDITKASEQAPTPPTRKGGPSKDGWQWPVSGSIVHEYNAGRARKGIDIGGTVGSPVYAASSGRVVYNGIGLKGYGKLVIIKHDKDYLSAYGFNRRTFVQQGQDVSAGTRIAEMGLGPENKPLLHFEIRRDGSPIDPEGVLPQQQ